MTLGKRKLPPTHPYLNLSLFTKCSQTCQYDRFQTKSTHCPVFWLLAWRRDLCSGRTGSAAGLPEFAAGGRRAHSASPSVSSSGLRSLSGSGSNAAAETPNSPTAAGRSPLPPPAPIRPWWTGAGTRGPEAPAARPRTCLPTIPTETSAAHSSG